MTTHEEPAVLPVQPREGMLRPLSLDGVKIGPSFWAQRQHTNRSAILNHAHEWMTRLGWVQNFLDATGEKPFEHRGKEFSDSEVYKLIEALSWELYRAPDASLQIILDDLIAAVLPAQSPDGYLHTRFGRPWQLPRYADFKFGHELYCFGHFIQAAVAHHRTTKETTLLDAATRLADHVSAMFGADGLQHVCGHPEIEMALIELHRVTGEPRYLDTAKVLIERRGQGTMPLFEFGTEYWQDARPVRDSDVLHGHAVRALYFAAGVVDLAVETGDEELLAVMERQWEHTVAARTYITGGMGSHHMDEAFGDDFVLPPDRSYCETCAGVASIMLSWRLLLATGKASYADLIERTLFNIVATSPSADGTSFFYANTLHQRHAHGMAAFNEDGVVIRGGSAGRQAWFEVSCCPPNLARTLASLQGYVATTSDDAVQLHQWVPADISAQVRGGVVAMRTSTSYPDDGKLTVEVLDAPADGIDVAVRIPSWARGSSVEVDGRLLTVDADGYLKFHLTTGAAVTIGLPVGVRASRPDPRIDAVRGCVAFERGPVVLALESVDLPEGWDINLVETTGLVLETADGPRAEIAKVTVPAAAWPYVTPHELTKSETHLVPLVNYHEWGERGPAAMRIFIPLATS